MKLAHSRPGSQEGADPGFYAGLFFNISLPHMEGFENVFLVQPCLFPLLNNPCPLEYTDVHPATFPPS